MSGSHATLHILADDLTGALDSAAAFAPGVLVHLGRPAVVAGGGGAVEVVATATRDIAPSQLPAHLAPCVDWLAGATLAFKKVDSLLRGNTFDELAWLMHTGAFDHAVFAPAFVAQGRVTRAGRAWMERAGAPPQALIAGSLIDACSARGLNAVVELPRLPTRGTVWIPDVATDADLLQVIDQARAWPRCLWCGSAGLAQAWARLWPDTRPPLSDLSMPDQPPMPVAPNTSPCADKAPAPQAGLLLVVSASHHSVSREQWARLLAARPDAITAQGGDEAPIEVALRALQHAGACQPLALFGLAPTERLTPEAAAALLARQIAQLCGTAPRPRQLVVVGGDTLLALCRAAGAQALRSQPALARSGWGCASLVGGRWDGVVCHSRSGAFGTPDDLVDVIDELMSDQPIVDQPISGSAQS